MVLHLQHGQHLPNRNFLITLQQTLEIKLQGFLLAKYSSSNSYTHVLHTHTERSIYHEQNTI